MFCVSVTVKLTVSLLCVCVHSAWKGRLQNDLYHVRWDVKPYSLTPQSTSVKNPNQPVCYFLSAGRSVVLLNVTVLVLCDLWDNGYNLI